MFSMEGRSLDEETVEYGWLLEIHLGKLSGKLTVPQLYHIVAGLETFLTLAIDAENELRPPTSQRNCHHGGPSSQCVHTKDEIKYRCPTSEDIKYRMTRVAIDVVDLYLIESGTALHTWVLSFEIKRTLVLFKPQQLEEIRITFVTSIFPSDITGESFNVQFAWTKSKIGCYRSHIDRAHSPFCVDKWPF